MKPCCLKAVEVDDIAVCQDDRRNGGTSSATAGACPASADEAAQLLKGVDDTPPTEDDAALAQNKGSQQKEDGTASAAGCCFSIGFGAMMKPCCLEAKKVSDVSTCQAHSQLMCCPPSGSWTVQQGVGPACRDCSKEAEVGGNHGYSLGECPASAEEAKDLIDSGPKVAKSKEDAATTEATTALEKIKLMQLVTEPPPLLQPITAAGCCFSFGYGAMMEPCCLEAHAVPNVLECKTARRIGGASSYKLGSCPTTAEEAANIEEATAEQTTVRAERDQTRFPAEAAASQTGQGGSSSVGGSPVTLLVAFLTGCSMLAAGMLYAARRRPSDGSTPFLNNEPVE